ncbi:MAG: lipopolysaccharide biosynthesis protein [Flavobacteriales bacterium]
MIRFKNTLLTTGFYRNAITLLKGSILSQLLPIIISPLLTRLYSPSEFGVLAVFTSISTILGSVINGRYEQALVLVRSKNEAQLITALSLLISFVGSGILFFLFLFVGPNLMQWLNISELENWFYYIPLVVFSIGFYNTLNYYELRKKQFKSISNSEVSRSISLSAIQLLYPFLKTGFQGLIIGKIISSFIAPLYLLRNANISFDEFRFKKMLVIAKRYIDFPKYTNSSILLNNLSLNAILLIIPIIYSSSILGLYSLMMKVMGTPFAFLGNSVNQVFLEHVARQKRETGNAFKITKQILIQLTILSVFSYGIAAFFMEDLFAFIFGEEWRLSGVYGVCLIPYFILKFIVSPLTSIHTAFEKQKLGFKLQILMFILSLTSIVFAYLHHWTFINYLHLFSALLSIFYILRMIIILRISKNIGI